MSHKALNEQITELHETLTNSSSLEPDTQRLLAELEAHIRPLVEQPNQADHSSLAERLESSLAKLEADHPILTTQITSLINALSNMGI